MHGTVDAWMDVTICGPLCVCSVFLVKVNRVSFFRTYKCLLRALDISTNLHESRSRLERSILRASRVLTKVKRSMDMDEIFLILKESSPVSCNTLIVLYACISDNFFGGYPLYYWMILCGDKWVVRVISDSNKVNLKKGD